MCKIEFLKHVMKAKQELVQNLEGLKNRSNSKKPGSKAKTALKRSHTLAGPISRESNTVNSPEDVKIIQGLINSALSMTKNQEYTLKINGRFGAHTEDAWKKV
jgi:hypothetical protein